MLLGSVFQVDIKKMNSAVEYVIVQAAVVSYSILKASGLQTLHIHVTKNSYVCTHYVYLLIYK